MMLSDVWRLFDICRIHRA